MKLKLLICTILILIVALMTTGVNYILRADTATYAYAPNNLIRLHVVSESNTVVDQSIKLEVRDQILNATSSMFMTIPEKEDARAMIEDNMLLMQEIAAGVVKFHGKNYPVKTELGHYYFPQTQYGDHIYPAGEYEALRIILGEGRGNNWWCVLFPPLCFADITSEDDIIVSEYPNLTEVVIKEDAVNEDNIELLSDSDIEDNNLENNSGWKLKTKSSISFMQLIVTPFSYLSSIFNFANN